MSLHAQWHRLFTFGNASALTIGLSAGFPGLARAQDPQDLPRPVITSVSSIVPRGTQTIVIRGVGFGFADPFNGLSPFIRIMDVAQGNWMSGWQSGAYWQGLEGPIYVTKWTDREIVIEGFPHYGQQNNVGGKQVFAVGDVVKIEVANPKGPALQQPSTSSHPEGVGVFSVRVAESATAPPSAALAPTPPGPGADPCTGCVVSLSIAPSVVVPGGAMSVFGIVQDGAGKPAGGATVEVSALIGGQSVTPAMATTHADGTFSVPFTAPSSAGTVTFHARMAGAPRAASVIATLKVAPN
jgi:hypothetical protein